MQYSFVNSELSDNIDDAISFAKKNELRFIELQYIDSKPITCLSKAEAFALSEKLSSNGILVSAISAPIFNWRQDCTTFTIFDKTVDNESEYFKNLLDLADIFGTSNIRIFSYLKQEDISLEDLGKKLDVYSLMALERGVNLLLEADKDCNVSNIADLHKLFELYGFSNIFPLIDMGKIFAQNDNYNPQELQDIINNCLYFHIKDYDSEKQRFVVLGEGDIDYETILADKYNDSEVFASLETATGHPDDLKMSFNVIFDKDDNI